MKTREEWETHIRATYDNWKYFLLLGTPGVKVTISRMVNKWEDTKNEWCIKSTNSSFYIASLNSQFEALELAKNCEWEVV